LKPFGNTVEASSDVAHIRFQLAKLDVSGGLTGDDRIDPRDRGIKALSQLLGSAVNLLIN
jgi:hypothetical protein